MNVDDLRYVQIGGCFKSGTSLLSALFEDHPQIASFPGETANTGWLYPYLVDPHVRYSEKVGIVARRCDEAQESELPYREIGRIFREQALARELKPFELHWLFLEARYWATDPAALERATIWMDKSPLSDRHADQIFERFPETRFIHLVREPKDTFASVGGYLLRKRGRRKTERALWQYRRFISGALERAIENVERFGPQRYTVVRFEELVSEPAAVLRRLCDFIGIEFESGLLSPTRAGVPYKGNNHDGLKFDGVFSGNVGRWRERIPPYHAAVIECMPGQPLHHFGYERAFSAPARHLALLYHNAYATWLGPKFLRSGFHDALFGHGASL